MDIRLKVEEYLNNIQETEAEIIEIFKTGSQLFRDNPTDLDYYVICNNFLQRRKKVRFEEDGIVYDIIILDKIAQEHQVDFEDNYYLPEALKLFNWWFLFKENVCGYSNTYWDLLGAETQYKEYLKDRYINSIGKRVDRTRGSKQVVQYYMPLKMYDNQSTEVTNEMKEVGRKLYEGGEQVLPIIDWVEEQLGI